MSRGPKRFFSSHGRHALSQRAAPWARGFLTPRRRRPHALAGSGGTVRTARLAPTGWPIPVSRRRCRGWELGAVFPLGSYRSRDHCRGLLVPGAVQRGNCDVALAGRAGAPGDDVRRGPDLAGRGCCAPGFVVWSQPVLEQVVDSSTTNVDALAGEGATQGPPIDTPRARERRSAPVTRSPPTPASGSCQRVAGRLLHHHDPAGSSRLQFTGRLDGHALAAGTYILRVTARLARRPALRSAHGSRSSHPDQLARTLTTTATATPGQS